MPDILEVTADDIARLLDSQLHQLIEQLLQAEKRHARRDDATIIVSDEVRAHDRGIDGEWTVELNPNEEFADAIPADVRQFIPAPSVIYQCKAKEMGPQECAKEVITDDDLKPAIRERLAVAPGEAAYVIACTQKVGNRDRRREREDKCAEQIQNSGIDAPMVRFLDAELLAEWSNRHIATRRFVVREASRELAAGVLLLQEWGRNPEVQEFPLCTNDELRRIISDIRNALARGTKIIRVTGNSGLGKTRIVYEVFNAILEGDGMSNDFAQAVGRSVVYIDLESKTSVADDLDAVREACLRGDRGIVVIDNCPVGQHEEFAKWFLDAQCELKLITMDYFEDEGSRGKSFRLRPEFLKGIVPEILRKSPVSQNLSDGAITAIAEFAQGYPRVAVLAAELGRAPTAADRNYKDYVERLLWGRNPPARTDRHKEYITALSAVAVFGFSGRVADQYPYLLRKLLQSDSIDDWKKELNYFTRRRILEPLGDFMVVSPAPVAVALFSQWLEETPPDDVVEFAQGLADVGLLEPFCRQLRRLGMNPTAGEIAERFCAGPFASAENLTSGTGSQILRSLAELNPSAVTAALRAALAQKTVEQILKIEGAPRRNLIDTCVRLAVEEPTFKDALWLLVLFAAAENEHWANNASGYLNQLFHSHLSGTHVSGFERLRLAREILKNDNQAIRKVMITAVSEGLQFGHFSRISTASLTRQLDATLDWQPANNEEELRYYGKCYEILHGIIMGGGTDSELARNALGQNITAILQTPLIETLNDDFKQLSQHLGHVWPEVKDHIKKILELREDLLPKHRLALERWKSYLTPPTSALEDRLKDVVSSPGWHHRKDADGGYIDLSEKEAEQLALELNETNFDLTPYLRQLMSGPQQQGFSFGATLGKNSATAMQLIEAAFALWPSLDPKLRNSSVLSGILWGLGKGKKRRLILDAVAGNGDLLDLLVPLIASTDAIEEADFLRISRAVEQGHLDPWKLRNLVQGQPMRNLPNDFITEQFRHLLRAKPEAAQVLFEVLFLHCHGQPEKFDAFAPLFRDLLLQKALPVFDGHFGWEWHDAAKRLITLTADEEWLGQLAQYVSDALLERQSSAGTDFLTAVISELFQKAPGVTWGVFSQGLREGNEFQKYILSRFLGRSGSRFDDTGSPLWNLPDDQFREWSRANRDLIPLVLEKISLYTVEKLENGTERFVWHPHARILLDEGIEQKDIAGAIAVNLLSFGSAGSRIPYLEKRLRLVEDLLAVDDPRLKEVARQLQQELKQHIQSTKRTELNEQARFL